MWVCLGAYLSVWVPICLFGCLSVCWGAYLSVGVPICLLVLFSPVNLFIFPSNTTLTGTHEAEEKVQLGDLIVKISGHTLHELKICLDLGTCRGRVRATPFFFFAHPWGAHPQQRYGA